MNFLSEIISRKQPQLETTKLSFPFEEVREAALRVRTNRTRHALRDALSNSDRINIIAEFKRRSPSKGAIRKDADPIEMSREYVSGGASAISVLTEENYFDGSLEDLWAIRNAVTVPLLRKDFIFDEYQVFEAAVAGADAVLLIVAALDTQLASLRSLIEDELGMDALVEVHDESELQRATTCGARLIGVNNRDLRTFEISLETSLRLIDQAPSDSILISESGLKTRKDLEHLHRVGYRGFLIGETLMRADSPGAALAGLLEPES